MSSTQQQLAPGERVLLIHYGELALKGENRGMFENRLKQNIQKALSDLPSANVYRLQGRFVVQVTEDQLDRAQQILKHIPGITYFSRASVVNTNLSAMQQQGVDIASSASFDTFSVRAKRSDKSLSFNSQDVNVEVGQAIVDELNKDVDLDDPDWTLRLEVMGDRTFLYGRKISGVGGLPSGVSGSVLTLLSGGIDSPVAAFQMMKRGCQTNYIHFHSFPFTDRSGQEKVQELKEKLDRHQPSSTLHLIPFAECQQDIVADAPSNVRILLYRRFMVRIAECLAKRDDHRALVTGENLGQVSSQTLTNMGTIEAAVKVPIFRPLVGYDKQEIIDQAKAIGTYEISIQPHQDCCSYLMPQKPSTSSTPEQLEEAESELNVHALVEETLAEMETE